MSLSTQNKQDVLHSGGVGLVLQVRALKIAVPWTRNTGPSYFPSQALQDHRGQEEVQAAACLALLSLSVTPEHRTV